MTNEELPAGRILFVDDDERLLAGIQRRLRRRFQLDVAPGPIHGLQRLEDDGPYAVVVADMTMPGMDGSTFLEIVRQRSPRSVRMMLTGNADLQTAARAVNQGNVFRFISKPCPAEDLEGFLRAGLEQHRLVDAEQRAAALEEASRAKSNFLATVSHELCTPLAGMKSSAEILLNYSDMTGEERDEFVRAILSESERLEHILVRILRMAQIDAGNVQPCPIPVNLQQLVVEGARELTVDVIGEPRPWHADESMIAEALQVLVDNVHLHASGSEAQIQLEYSTDAVQLRVEDHGPGLPPEMAEHVFEPFVQSDCILVDKPHGIGVGLTIASAIAHLHGGELTHRPRPGGGAIFELTLPAVESDSAVEVRR